SPALGEFFWAAAFAIRHRPAYTPVSGTLIVTERGFSSLRSRNQSSRLRCNNSSGGACRLRGASCGAVQPHDIVARVSEADDRPRPLFQQVPGKALGAQIPDTHLQILTLLIQAGQLSLALGQ